MMKLIIYIGLLVLLPGVGSGQVITTWAGNGTNSNTGDGGLAMLAGIYQPSWGVFDKQGNYYVCSGLGHQIRKISPNGIITLVAGGVTGVGGYNGDGGLADTSKIYFPGSVTVDSIGNIFIADIGNHRIRKVDVVTGIISTVAGTGTVGFNGDGISATSAQLNNPNDLCFDKNGNLFFSDAANFRVRKINPQGVISTVIGNGIPGNSGDGGLAVDAKISSSRGIALDTAGNLYVVNQGVGALNVRKVDMSTGIINTVAGTGIADYNGDEISANSANMGPVRVAFDNYGELYISDNYNDRIRKVNADGIISTVAGNGIMGYSGDGGLATFAQLNSPSGIAFDSCNNMYITEVQQGRIRKVSFNPNCWPLNINQTTPLSFSIHPNPVTSQLTITSTNKIKQTTITDITGREVLYSTENTIDVSGLVSGVYFVRVWDVNGNDITQKIIKQ